jgi:hypothetical protein
MLASSTRIAVIAATAAALTGTAAFGQQQLASNDLEGDHAARLAACGRIADIANRAGCEAAEYERNDRAVTAIMKQRAAAARETAAAAREETKGHLEAAAKTKAESEANIAVHRDTRLVAEADIRCSAALKSGRQAQPPVYDPEVARNILRDLNLQWSRPGVPCQLVRTLCTRKLATHPDFCSQG